MLRSLLLAVTTLLLLWLIHGDVLWSASELDVSADGVKNLFTFAWHSEHSEEWFNMDGMAAPFGEHFFYTDGHPLLSMLWRPIVRTMGWQGWSGPLIGWLITLSWILTPPVLFRLLRLYGARSGISFAGAILITLLAPQIMRAEGHYSLNYTLFIPLLWWWLTRYVQSGRLWHWFLLFLLNTVALGTHAYLGLITTAFTTCYLIIPAFLPEKRSRSMQGTLSALIPLLLFIAILNLTDHHPCRINDPGGFFEMRSTLSAVLLPQSGPFHSLSHLFNTSAHWEGRAYIGLSALILLMAGLLSPFFSRHLSTAFRTRPLAAPLFAALILFAIACGQPFVWLGETTLERVPYLQQFRGIGRLAWPLYFVLTLLAVLLLDVFRRSLPSLLSFGLILLILSLWSFEAYHYHADLAQARKGHSHPISHVPPYEVAEAVRAIKESGADLIIPLPYFHVGSEFYGRASLPEAEWLTFSTAYHSGVPTSAALLTRTSLPETRDLLRLIALPRHERNLKAHFQHTDTIALLKTHDQLRRDEAYWWNLATPVLDGDLGVRLLPAAFLFGTKAPDACTDTLLMSISPEPYHFDARKYHTIWSSSVPDDWLMKEMEITIRFEALKNACLKGRGRLKPRLIVQRRDGDKVTWLDHTYPEAASEQADDGSWARPSLTFRLDSIPDLIECVVIAEQAPYDVSVEHFMLREVTCP